MSFLVLIHEAAHLIFAKIFGVYCFEFSIGMGPLIKTIKTKETSYSIRLLPIGGYVQMAGEGSEELLDGIDENRKLDNKSFLQQFLIINGGAIVNILFAFILFLVVAFALPYKTLDDQIYFVQNNDNLHIHQGDKLISIIDDQGEKEIKSVNDIAIAIVEEKMKAIKINRDTQIIKIDMSAEQLSKTAFAPKAVKKEFFDSFKIAIKNFIGQSSLIFSFLANLIKGVGLKHVSGPIGIFKVTETVLKTNFLSFLNLMAVISLNLGILNLLPIPAMDGGRSFILIIEKLLGRKINEKFKNTIIIGSFILLMALIVIISLFDIIKLF